MTDEKKPTTTRQKQLLDLVAGLHNEIRSWGDGDLEGEELTREREGKPDKPSESGEGGESGDPIGDFFSRHFGGKKE